MSHSLRGKSAFGLLGEQGRERRIVFGLAIQRAKRRAGRGIDRDRDRLLQAAAGFCAVRSNSLSSRAA